MFWESALLGLFIIIIVKWVASRGSSLPELPNIPIISRIPLVGSMIALYSFKPDNLHLKFHEYVQRFGKSFQARVFGVLVLVTADLRYVEVLLSSQTHIRKNVIYGLLRSWLGEGLLLSYDWKWQAMRKIITPTFHFKILEAFVKVFDQQSAILVEKLRPFANGKTALDIYPYVGLATLDIIAETAMGVRVNAQHNSKSDFVQAVKDVTSIVSMRFVRPYLGFPWIFRLLKPELYQKQLEGIATMHNFTEKIIEQRRALLRENVKDHPLASEEQDMGIKECKALLDVLLQATIDGEPLTDTQIRDEVNTFMFEGHDTTTTAISFCLYLLSRNAACQQKLYEEIRDHFGDDLERPIIYRDLLQLVYLNCIVKESLRLYPPIPAIKLDVSLPAGTNVIILLWEILRDESIFKNASEFQPERHLAVDQRLPNSFSNIPFSAGPRNCIGQRFALFELKTIVVKIMRHYELLALGEPVQPTIKIVLRSKNGVNFGLLPRVY